MNKNILDKVHIRALRARCILGIFPEEREKAQEIELNITLHADLRAAGQSDNIDDTVDYKTVKIRVLELVEHSSFFLVERLAQAVADVCLDNPRVEMATIILDKPGALRFAQSVAVEITRNKSHG
ncbi:MAG: dihydroneopterin aldolase [Candidatus Hydrogenedentes bacterium]|nr:dihydroneopterin aldolase [Candidatus Hydrogenedentota bacterium]